MLFRREEDSPEILYLSDAVRILGDSIDSDTTVRLEIRRSCVVKDALRESNFNHQGLLKVSSTNVVLAKVKCLLLEAKVFVSA